MSDRNFIIANNLQYKEHYARYLITINSNRVIYNREDPYRYYFREFIRNLIFNFKNAPYYKSIDGFPLDPNPFVSIIPKIEIGGRLGRMHSHLIVEIYYDGRIRIDLDKIRAINEFKCGGWYLNVRHDKAGSRATERLLKYIREETPGENLFY